MRIKKYISGHKGIIKKAAIVGVPTVAGIAIGCRAGLIPYKQIAGAAVKAGRKIPLNKIPVKQIGMKAKDGVEMLAGNETVAKAGHALKQELKRELKGEARRFVSKKIKEGRIAKTVKKKSNSQASGKPEAKVNYEIMAVNAA